MEQASPNDAGKIWKTLLGHIGGWRDKLQGRSAPVLGRSSRVQMPTMLENVIAPGQSGPAAPEDGRTPL